MKAASLNGNWGCSSLTTTSPRNSTSIFLDPTKIIPEEILPLRVVGRLVLERNVDNFFSETEQVAFCVRNVVPGIDFSNDPLLQGRIFSYLDTQLKRLGGPNFQQIPVNAPKCPVMHFQRDGHMQMSLQKGRVNYSPSSLQEDTPRQDPGWASFQRNHIVSAFTFELSKVNTKSVRERMVGQLANVDSEIAGRVAKGLGLDGPLKAMTAAVAAKTDLKPSPALSILAKAKPTLEGRKIGCLIADGSDSKIITALRTTAENFKADFAIVAPRVGGAEDADGKLIEADFQLAGGSSVLFDAVFVTLDETGAATLSREAAAVAWVHDAYSHCKVVGATPESKQLIDSAGVIPDEGIITGKDAAIFSRRRKKGASGRANLNFGLYIKSYTSVP